MQLKVANNGTKSFILNYRCPCTQKMTSISFGVYPEISLADARAMRREARSLIAKGINPKHHKEQQEKLKSSKRENTFCKIAEKWFEVTSVKLQASTADKIWRNLELHLFPYIGDRPLHEITAQDTIHVLQPIKAQGHFTVIQRLCQSLNRIMSFGVNTGVITHNPLTGIKDAFQSPHSRNHRSITPDRLPELMVALQSSNIQIKIRCLVEFQLHTMSRPAEAAKVKWSDLDLEKNIWIMSKHKMQQEGDAPHIIPLTVQTREIIERIRPISGRGEYIFPSHKDPKQHINTEASNNALKRTTIGKEQTGHALRTLARTAVEEQGFNHFACEACLAHKTGSQVSQIYNKSNYLKERVEIMEWWSNYIEKSSIGNTSITSR